MSIAMNNKNKVGRGFFFLPLCFQMSGLIAQNYKKLSYSTW